MCELIAHKNLLGFSFVQWKMRRLFMKLVWKPSVCLQICLGAQKWHTAALVSCNMY